MRVSADASAGRSRAEWRRPPSTPLVGDRLANGARRQETSRYEVWNEPDDDDLLAQRPPPPRLRGALEAAYPALKAGDPSARRPPRRPRRQRLRARPGAVRQRRQGPLRRRRRPHGHRAPPPARRVLPRADGRLGRYSFTGTAGPRRDGRQRRRQAGLDDRARVAHDNATCSAAAAPAQALRRQRDQQAGYLAKAYACLAGDP